MEGEGRLIWDIYFNDITIIHCVVRIKLMLLSLKNSIDLWKYSFIFVCHSIMLPSTVAIWMTSQLMQ